MAEDQLALGVTPTMIVFGANDPNDSASAHFPVSSRSSSPQWKRTARNSPLTARA